MIYSNLQYFQWLVEQLLSGLLYAWPISLGLLILLGLTLVFQFRYIWVQHQTQLLFLLIPFIMTIFILVIGTIFHHHGRSAIYPATQMDNIISWLVWGCFLLHIPIGICLSAKFKSFWYFVISLTLLQMWISLWATIMAAMSVSGEWL